MQGAKKKGYTLVEIVVALVVFTTGALALSAGSAVLTREMATNAIRAAAARLARNRQETAQGACRSVESGSETRGGLTSVWTVSRSDSVRLRISGTVSYQTPRGTRADSYSLAVRCL